MVAELRKSGNWFALGYVAMLILPLIAQLCILVPSVLTDLIVKWYQMFDDCIMGLFTLSEARKGQENVLKQPGNFLNKEKEFLMGETARPPDIFISPESAKDILPPTGKVYAQEVVSESKSVEFEQESVILRGGKVRKSESNGCKQRETASNDFWKDCSESASAGPVETLTIRGDRTIDNRAQSAPVDPPLNPFLIAIESANEQVEAPQTRERSRIGDARQLAGADEGTGTSRTHPAAAATSSGGAPTPPPLAVNARGGQEKAPGNGFGERAAENAAGRGGWVATRPRSPGGSQYHQRSQHMVLQEKVPIKNWPIFAM